MNQSNQQPRSRRAEVQSSGSPQGFPAALGRSSSEKRDLSSFSASFSITAALISDGAPLLPVTGASVWG